MDAFLFLLFKIRQTFRTNVLPFVVDDVFCVSAEDASRFVFFQYDVASVYKNLQRVLDVDVQGPPKLDGDDDSAQFVNLSYNACRFHKYLSLSKKYIDDL